jgi:hypothetical protein
MKKLITKEEQQRINELLDARKNKVVKSKDQQICDMLQDDWNNTTGSETGKSGMTYLEVEQFNNTYNNF